MIVLACIPVAIWTYLLFGRGGFWRVSKHLPPTQPTERKHTRVAALIPARDEAATIRQTVVSLKEQKLPPVRILVVDDNSTDNTRAIASSAGAEVVQGKPLPPGWTGKLWALSQGVSKTEDLDPDYLLFTDADIEHDPHTIQQLVAVAERGPYDLVSFMAKLACDTFPEKAIVPAFVFFFFMLYPPGKSAGAAGGCMLIRPAALRRMGGIEAIRGEVIDDCALARGIDETGGRVWLGLTPTTRSIRRYRTFGELGSMISRSAFSQLRHSGLLLSATTASLVIAFALPPALIASGRPVPMALGGTAWLLMSATFYPMIRFYGCSWIWSFSLPAVALFYAGATVYSAAQYWVGKGGSWKGRVQDAPVR